MEPCHQNVTGNRMRDLLSFLCEPLAERGAPRAFKTEVLSWIIVGICFVVFRFNKVHYQSEGRSSFLLFFKFVPAFIFIASSM
jgi:hypothetical protein